MKFTKKTDERRLVISVRIILNWILNILGLGMWTECVALIHCLINDPFSLRWGFEGRLSSWVSSSQTL